MSAFDTVSFSTEQWESATQPTPTEWGQYDAVNPKDRRRSPSNNTSAEERILTAGKRKSLVGGMRDLQRNFALARWMINYHLDNIASFTFHATTDNEDVNRRLEQLVKIRSRPENCDVTGRHSLSRLVRLLEECRLVDGDVFVHKLSDGRLQVIEGDRIRDPEGFDSNTDGNVSEVPENMYLVQGVRMNKLGRPLSYAVHNRVPGSASYEFAAWKRARHILHHGWFARFDQVRGVSPLASAYNAMQDLYEAIDMTLAKIKVAQMFGLKITRSGDTAPATVSEDEQNSGGYKVDFGAGPVLLDLDPDDDAAFLENKTPSTEFREFVSTLIELCIKSLHIPFSAYDPSATNYSGARQALLEYEQHCRFRRHELQVILDKITWFWITQWLESSDLVIPPGLDLETLSWEWRPRAMPWIDPLKEAQAYEVMISNGLSSRQEICKLHGKDFADVASQLKREVAVLPELQAQQTQPRMIGRDDEN